MRYRPAFFLLLLVTVLFVHACGGEKSRFQGKADGIILDSQTGLEWFVCPESSIIWDDAKTWSSKLAAGGGGWRLPTRAELKAIHVQGKGLDPVFKTQLKGVWSADLFEGNDSMAWVVTFEDGSEYYIGRKSSGDERCLAVRARK